MFLLEKFLLYLNQEWVDLRQSHKTNRIDFISRSLWSKQSTITVEKRKSLILVLEKKLINFFLGNRESRLLQVKGWSHLLCTISFCRKHCILQQLSHLEIKSSHFVMKNLFYFMIKYPSHVLINCVLFCVLSF